MKKRSQLLPKSMAARLRAIGCIVCGSHPVDLDHWKTRGSGGEDYIYDNGKAILNLLPLCRACHTEKHTIGAKTFADKYLQVKKYLDFLKK